MNCDRGAGVRSSRRDDLERINIQDLVGYDAFETSILVLEHSPLRDIADLHAVKLGLPLVECRLADAVLATKILVALPASCCLRIATIRGSLNRLVFTVVSWARS
jgi:hypothetical protein